MSGTVISGIGAGPGVSSSVSVIVSSAGTKSNHRNHTDAHSQPQKPHKHHTQQPSPNQRKHTTKVIVSSGGTENRHSPVSDKRADYAKDGTVRSNCSSGSNASGYHSHDGLDAQFKDSYADSTCASDTDGRSSILSDYIQEVHDIRLSIPSGRHVHCNSSSPASTVKGDRKQSLTVDDNAALTGSEDDLSKTPDEGEAEVGWLKDAGFEDIVSHIEEGKPLDDTFLKNATSTLTQKQANAVKKRVDTLRATQSKKQHKKTDIRQVDFAQNNTDNSSQSYGTTYHANGEQGAAGPPSGKTRVSSVFKNRGGYTLPDGDGTDHHTGNQNVVATRATSYPLPPPVANDSFLYSFILDDKYQQRHTTAVSSPTKSALLPAVEVYRARQGITTVTDLGRGDISRLRHFSLLELTAVCDENNVVYSRRKAKKRYKDNGVFGVPLEALLEHDQKRNKSLKVPRIIRELIDYLTANGLEEEGILRVPGSIARMKSIRHEVDERFHSSGALLPDWSQLRPNDVAGLLKQFLRELPVPLLTFQYLEAFAQIESIKSFKVQLNALNLLVLLLPDAHREVLKVLLKFLHDVVTVESNKMTLDNVAMIMAPNLFLVGSPRKNKAHSIASHQINEIDMFMATGTINIVRMLIQYQNVLWIVPSTLVDQVRVQTVTDNAKKFKEKPIYKLLGRNKDKSESKKESMRLEADTILVTAPDLTKFNTKVKLGSDMTAGDVVDKFRRDGVLAGAKKTQDKKQKRKETESNPSGKDAGIFAGQNTYLYEMGGNIGERRLRHSIRMKELLQINPKAEWVIKSNAD